MQMSQKKDIIKDASVLGIPKMLLLGLQHMFAMFGATTTSKVEIRFFPFR